MSLRRKKDKLGSAAHIKRNTEGTSNEISFSVLDAAKMEFEGKLKRPEPSGLGRISLFTLGGRAKSHETPTRNEELPLSGSSPAPASARPRQESKPSQEYEIARRKGRRKLHRIAAGVFVAVACVAIAFAAGSALLGVYKANQGSVSTLQDALSTISAADETFVDLDRVVENPINPDNEDTVATLETELPSVRESLGEAYGVIDSAFEGIVNPRDREAASNALGSVDARIEMVDHGSAIVAEVSSALSARSSAVTAWNDILTADSLAREAAKLANEGTAESVTESRARTEEALSALNEASYLLSTAMGVYPAADFSAYVRYVEQRIEAFNHAIASDDAFLAEDTETALSENDAYNQADAAAAALAADLPSSIESVVEEAFSAEMKDETEAYGAARERAASTDAFLRTYRETQ